MKKFNAKTQKEYYGLLVLSFVTIMLFSLRNISKLTNIMAWDEIGYWGNGAYIAGYDWSSVVSTYAGYYSYGYSLIIAVLLKLFGNSHIAYQAAIAINALFNAGSFLLANYVGVKYFSWNKKYYILITSIIVSMYINNITQSNCAWTECELIFLYWCLVALFLSLNTNYKFYKIVFIAVLSIYMYCVHNRSVGIVIASALTIVLFVFIKRIPKKDVLFLIVIVLLIGSIEIFYKINIKQNVYIYKADTELVNTYTAVAPWITSKFQSLYGIKDLIKTFLNRFLYFGITTFGVFGVFCIWAMKKIYSSVLEKELDYFLFFIILSVLGVFGVMTIQLSQSGTYQALLYGRYQDIVIGPSFFLGLMYMISGLKGNKMIKRYAVFTPVIMWLLLIICRSIPIYSDYFVTNCNTSLYKFWVGTDQGGYNFEYMFLYAVLLMSIYAVICFFNRENKKLGMILLLLFTITYSSVQVKDSEDVFYSFYNNYQDMADELLKIHGICEDENEIYYYNDPNLSITTQLAMWLQLEMYEHKIIVVNDLHQVLSGMYMVVPRRKISDTDYQVSEQPQGELVSEYKFAALYLIK